MSSDKAEDPAEVELEQKSSEEGVKLRWTVMLVCLLPV